MSSKSGIVGTWVGISALVAIVLGELEHAPKPLSRHSAATDGRRALARKGTRAIASIIPTAQRWQVERGPSGARSSAAIGQDTL
jgi:hypothetical protein